ncbi:MAG: sigma-70 family RNA polymerase sigma factor [Silvibacterium sp.]|nr:sigma-70 family RNA polymerase sigma factor [Silvibacterium sp.]MBV8437283.1 sigma-70 family RNA polymerase sigma factor [Silvibacterium sp.]
MDPEFFEAAAMPLFDQLYNFAHWLTGNRSDAEDLVQETYAKALKGFRSFQEGTNLRAWMYRILRNSFLTSRTGLGAHNVSPLDDEMDITALAAHSLTPEFLVLQQEGKQTVRDALACLPLNYREVILLCEIEEMQYKEIAEVLGVPIGTVMSRLARARKMLRELLTAKPTEKVSKWTVIKTPSH